ncbi:hypothetical protein HMPREF1051_1496 [Neisseria sicca VK64]|uniref:Uncharacterized protein n=1 Tax=Neisseria sicca VK64 TaxID=1095748 RepID=I2NPB5_NEISI|nr:hypothetical protein HMPREF1051_1496 [Neisseria sicca VK64]
MVHAPPTSIPYKGRLKTTFSQGQKQLEQLKQAVFFTID